MRQWRIGKVISCYSPGMKYESSKYHTDRNELMVAVAPSTRIATLTILKCNAKALLLVLSIRQIN